MILVACRAYFLWRFVVRKSRVVEFWGVLWRVSGALGCVYGVLWHIGHAL